MKKLWFVAFTIVILAIGGWFIYQNYFNSNQGVAGEQNQPQSSASPASDVEESLDAQSRVSALIDGVNDDPEGAVVEDLREEFDPIVGIPAGSHVDSLPETWLPDGMGGGTMNAVLSTPNQEDQYFLVVVVEVDGEWKVLSTFAQEVQS